MTDRPTRTSRGSGRRGRDIERPPAPEPLPAPVTDSHCHLDIADDDVAASDRDDGHVLAQGWWPVQQALEAATAVNVTRIVQVGCDRAGVAWAVRCASEHDEIVAAVAVHPNEAPRLAGSGELDDALAEVDAAAASPRVRAIGETGLDHFRTAPDGQAIQEHSFREHIRLAKRHDKALVIHDRDAHADVLRVLADEGAPDRTVFHCFSGDAAMARVCAREGYVLSFSGTVTFKNAGSLREALSVAPVENLLVETDAPYLTPTPHRGRTNASYLVPWTVRTMAGVLHVPVQELCERLQATTDRVFGPW